MAKLTFRARKAVRWDGKDYEPGDLLEIEEGNPRLRAMIEQSRILEYASQDAAIKPPTVVTSVG